MIFDRSLKNTMSALTVWKNRQVRENDKNRSNYCFRSGDLIPSPRISVILGSHLATYPGRKGQ